MIIPSEMNDIPILRATLVTRVIGYRRQQQRESNRRGVISVTFQGWRRIQPTDVPSASHCPGWRLFKHPLPSTLKAVTGSLMHSLAPL